MNDSAHVMRGDRVVSGARTLIVGVIRTALLILSPRRLSVSIKTFLLWRRLRNDPEARDVWNQYFNPVDYERNNPDVVQAGVNPWVHFLLCGNDDLRLPSFQFDTPRYLKRYPDVKASGINALLHFALFGHREKRSISRLRPALMPDSGPVICINNDWRRDHPLVTVVIPCFNYGRFVEAAIRSALNQTFQDIEVVVVEGGSSDPSSVAEVRRLDSLGLPKTRFYFRSERHLAGDNRNFGIGMAKGRYICCLDADDLLQPVYLEVAVFLAEVYGFDLVTSAVQNFGGSDSRWLIVGDPAFPQVLNANQVATSALFRRSAWAQTGGYKDWGVGRDYVPEDWDFWVRMLGHGCQAISIPEPLLLYRVHQDSLSRRGTPKIEQQRETIVSSNVGLDAETSLPDPAEIPRTVLNPWANLGPLEDGRESILLALPFVGIGGAETLFRTIGARLTSHGHRLIVTTSVSLPASVPENTGCFKGITDHVYHLTRLFKSDDHQRDFLFWLVRRYAIRKIMIAGSLVVYRMLPDLKQEFPELIIIDQLFNDSGHVGSNRLYSKQIDATIVPSEQLRRVLIEQHGADDSMVHVIPHAAEAPSEVCNNSSSSVPLADPNQVVVAFFGRMSEEKGPDLFIDIVRKLATHQELQFVMTGEGPEREKILRQIERYGLRNRIYAPGFVDDVFPLMRSADIVVLPSRVDGMPLVVLESQALGKAVVASRVGSLPAMIEDGESGFLCEPGDVEAFRGRILQLARDPALRKRVQEGARRSVAARYAPDQMLEAYERVFETAVLKKSAGR
jgi:O-antigen biosynthesis protein